ncbi:MAG: aldo/keto reductase [Oscillospiraceae bacterium]|nr:aldo/keto reductase [Oscillospiraceae bacterium]
MRYKKLGGSDLNVSVVGVGTWAMGGDFWGKIEDDSCIAAIQAALDNGVNLIDTAPIYGKGYSEEIVGKAIKGRDRSKIIVATKCGIVWGEKSGRDASAKTLPGQIDASLKRLGVDYIDLMQIHWPDTDTPIAESVGALEDLRKAGKIRHFGVSNFSVPQLQEAMDAGALASTQPQYSLLERAIEKDILPFCAENNIGVLSYGSLGAGALTGKFTEPPQSEGTEKRSNFYSFFAPEVWPKVLALVDVLRGIADERQKPVAHVAINWVAQQTGVTTALVGIKNIEQAQMNASAATWELSAEELGIIADAYARIF